MALSKQSSRRRLAKLRAEFYAAPWAMDVRALGLLGNAIEGGDLEAIQAALSLGRDAESIAKMINGVAVIPITGALRDEVDYMVRWGYASSYQLIEREFNQAIENGNVKGVLFYIDSPGGSAIGCKRIADLVFESRGEKPIRAFVQGVCCSAAYYIAAATDRIDATADSLIGSIGTIYPHLEYSGMLKEFGVSAKVFTNADSPRKGHGNIYEPLSDAAKQTLQQFVDSYGRPFVEDVARYRGVAADEVVEKFGQGDALRADVAISRRMIDAVVGRFEESLESISSGGGDSTPVEETESPPDAPTGNTPRRNVMNERIKAQLFALGLIDSLDASDQICQAALNAWARASGETLPSDETQVLSMLQEPKARAATTVAQSAATAPTTAPATNPGAAIPGATASGGENHEQFEARLEDLTAASEILNETLGYEAVTAAMVLAACKQKLNAAGALKAWSATLSQSEKPVAGARVNVTGEGADRFAADAVDAMVFRAGNQVTLSDGAQQLINRPLWAVAGECLRLAGQNVDMYGNKEAIAEQAMAMGFTGQRHTFFSASEDRRYVQASGTPVARPGDFPNILSGLMNRYLDTLQLDDDYSYPLVSALLPGGLNDFKPGLMVNKGIVEELDELQDAEQFKELGLQEEVLSYIFLRRFGNKWGWTPVLVANDDMNAFAEGMLGLEEAWQVTQNRLVVDRYSSGATEALLDGSALFADRANTGSGANPAANNNLRSSGNPPSDTEWEAMDALYADIGGIATGRRVRGSLNVAFVPTGAVKHAAVRTFEPFTVIGEGKMAETNANMSLFRGQVTVVPESELRVASSQVWYGLRNPTRLNTATVVRGYFNGFGQSGRRERWYDPERKVTWVSIEGRIAVAVKNWRFAVRNAGTGAG